jgi:fumarate reductase flavoprotein subunit
MELGPRDRLSQAFWHEQQKSNTVSTRWGEVVHLDMRQLGEKKINERLPLVRDLATSYVGADPVHELVPVRPVVHYMMGGIHTDIDAATPMPGLYAAGECACVSINGANRLGSNSLTELLVFGGRAGRHAAQYARSWDQGTDDSLLLKLAATARQRVTDMFLRDDVGERVSELRKEMNDTMESGAGIYRDEESLKTTCDKLAELRRRYARVHLEDKSNVFNTQLIYTMEVGSMLEAALTISHSALERKESRGSHQRLDHPERDDERYLKHSLAYYSGDAAPRIDYLDVTITKSPPGERLYGGDA